MPSDNKPPQAGKCWLHAPPISQPRSLIAASTRSSLPQECLETLATNLLTLFVSSTVVRFPVRLFLRVAMVIL